MKPAPTREKTFGTRAAMFAVLLALSCHLTAIAVPAAHADPGSASRRNDSFRREAEAGKSVSLPGNARSSERLFGLPGLSNVGRVEPCILRGSQPLPEGYETLRKMGIRTVVNLRMTHGEKTEVEAAGMRSVEIPMDTMKNIDPAAVRKVLSVLTDPENLPVFVHCAQGKDRTGVVVAVYRMEVDGWSEAEAEAEMEAFGFHEIWFQLKKFVRRYPDGRMKGRDTEDP